MTRHRILRLITWLPMGGIERKIVAVLPRLNRDLFDVHLCCIRERGPLAEQLEKEGVPVHLVPFRSRLDPIGLLKLRRLTRRLQIDLIHSHMYRANTPATALKIFDKNVAVVGHYHNVDTWETNRQLRMDRFMALRRDMNVAVSEAVRRNVEETLGLPPELTTTLYNCVDLDEFRRVSESERMAIRRDLGLLPEHKVVIMVARMVAQKNHELVVSTAPDLLREFPMTRFIFAGGGPDEEALKAQSARLGVSDAMLFLGRRNDIPRLIAASDVSVLPSFKEGFSNAVLEAMACGVPMIASNVGGNPEIIEHGTNGYLLDVQPRNDGSDKFEVDSTSYLRLMKRCLGDNEHRERLGQAAYEKSRHYGIDAMVREIEQLYLEVLEKR